MELFPIRKIRRICPRHRGPDPSASAHGSMNFIKRRPLAFGLMAQIERSEPLSRLLISAVHHWSDGRGGWLRPGAARHGWAWWLTEVWVFSSYGGQFSMRFAPTGSQRWGERDYANLNRRREATEPSNSEAARRCLVTVRAASGEASAPRTCAKASSSSLLASR
jgi:hypothetical protein